MKTVYLILLISIIAIACAPEDLEDPGLAEEGQYIVVYRPSSVQDKVQSLGVQSMSIAVNAVVNDMSDKVGAIAVRSFSSTINAGVFRLTQAQLLKVKSDPQVAYVEPDHIISVNTIQQNPEWGLDRLDQQATEGDAIYEYSQGSGQVHAYVIDTGINIDHQEFEGRAVHGVDLVDQDSDSTDCNGHGTHVAGTIGGKTYGVAKNVKLVGIRALNCRGSGRYSDIIAGVEWVKENHIKPAVANMSLGGPSSQALEDAVDKAVQAGVVMVVAAGNSNRDACDSSPAKNVNSITVGASDQKDKRASFSNFGSCVDIFAPGVDIKSAWYDSNSVTKTIDGTSMAAPHVAGVVSLYLSKNPTASPLDAREAVVGSAVANAISDNRGSANFLLNSQFLLVDDGSGGGDEPPVKEEVVELKNGDLIESIAGIPEIEPQLFKIVSTESVEKIKIAISGGSGDADLYVKAGSGPQKSDYDCRPYKGGNVESCEIEAPGNVDIFVKVYAYSEFSGLQLQVEIEEKEEVPEIINPCPSCIVEEGEVQSTNSFNYHPNGSYYRTRRTETHEVYLVSPESANLDLYIYRWSGSRWEKVAQSTATERVDKISKRLRSGYYTVKVISKSGSGNYQVYRKAN
ncbi:MAG: S8 family serine peptidase [Bdellovibrionales bacterium]